MGRKKIAQTVETAAQETASSSLLTQSIPAIGTEETNDELAFKQVNDMQQERDTANQLLGRIQLAQRLTKLLNVSSLIDLKKIKEDKSYKHLTVKDKNGELLTVSSWAQFCDLLGKSHKSVDESLLNLSTFGEEALKSMQQAGLGYHTFRKLRDEDRKIIVQEVEADAGDKDSILQLIDDLSAKHTAESQQLQEKIKQAHTKTAALERDLGIRDQQLKDSQASLNRLDAEVRRLTTLEAEKPDEAREQWAGSFVQSVNAASTRNANLIAQIARIQSIEGTTPDWMQRMISSGIAGLIDELKALQRQFDLNALATAPDLVDWARPDQVLPQYLRRHKRRSISHGDRASP